MRYVAMLLAVLVSVSAFGDEITHDKVFTENIVGPGLTVDDLQDYERIMKGPMGVFYRRGEANVYYVLAAEAKTENERMKYARAWVEAERVYSERLGEAIRAFSVASIERFGANPQIFDMQAYDKVAASVKRPESADVSRRVKLYVSLTNCGKCVDEYLTQKRRLDNGEISAVDIYFVGTIKGISNDERSISQWAMNQVISPQTVKQKRITLNFDDGKIKGTPPYVQNTYILD